MYQKSNSYVYSYLWRKISVNERPCLDNRKDTIVGGVPVTAAIPRFTASSPVIHSTPATPKSVKVKVKPLKRTYKSSWHNQALPINNNWQAAPWLNNWAVVDCACELGKTVSEVGSVNVVGKANASIEWA